ncbi:MAG: LicD family protein [Opitutus sp.]|nr:LicD family protein [Opitutus sp.]
MKETLSAVSLSEMRALQLESLDAFGEHCRANGLRYYIWAGTLLGAMRHGGYIPWDDDIDVAMPRPDYERLRREFSGSALAARYGLYHLDTDPTCDLPIAKLTDPRALVLGDTRAPVGVGIDIFPLDRWPAGRLTSTAALFGQRMFFLGCWIGFTDSIARPAHWSRAKWMTAVLLLKIFHGRLSPRGARRALDWFLSTLRGPCANVGTHWIGPVTKLRWETYGEPTSVTFENRLLPGPADPIAVLDHLYGNWREPPPSEARRGHNRTSVVWSDAHLNAALARLDARQRMLLADVESLRAIVANADSASDRVSVPEIVRT